MRKINATPSHIRSIIAEERELLAEYNRYNQVLIREANRMRSEGYDRYQINEGLLDIIKSLGTGFIETFKYQIALYLLDKIGLNPKGFLAQLVANIVENADLLEFKKYFGPGACDYLPDLIMDSFAETAVLEPFLDGIIVDLLGLEDSRMANSAREALTNYITSSEFVESMKTWITEKVCDIDISDIINKFRGMIPGFGEEAAAPPAAAAG